MTDDATPTQSPDQDLYDAAARDEQAAASEAVIQALRARCVGLNVEVRRRDARIAELEAALAQKAGE